MTNNVTYEQDFEESIEICERVLQPFKFLRGLASAKVSGVAGYYEYHVDNWMMSNEPAEKLWEMETALLDWCDRWARNPENTTSDAAMDMINDCNNSSLKMQGARLAEQSGASRHKRQRAPAGASAVGREAEAGT